MGKLKKEFRDLLTEYLAKIEKNKTIEDIIIDFRNKLNNLINFDIDKDTYILNTDGASNGNPGPAQIGIICKSADGSSIFKISKNIGIATNNEAEYEAVIEGVKEALKKGIKKLLLLSDSELVVKQLNNEYKVKNKKLWDKYVTAQKLFKKFEKVNIRHISRKYNSEADFYSKKGLF